MPVLHRPRRARDEVPASEARLPQSAPRMSASSDLLDPVRRIICFGTRGTSVESPHRFPLMNITTRERLGPYRIIGPLGSGGMGEVYVARDPSLGRTVAIKVLPQRFSGDRESLSRFTREARSASALNHPNIVTIHEVGTESGTPYIVMEHIEG